MNALLGDLGAWQQVLDRHSELFSGMAPGSCIGIAARSSGFVPGKRASVPGEAAALLTWECEHAGMRARMRCCDLVHEARIDLLLVADDEALEQVRAQMQAETLSAMKRMIRRGNILFYAMRNKHQLQEAGYEDFLDSLGLAFLGACR